jgi:hypothetical protein
MPIINLTTLQDALGGTEAVNATVTAYVYRGTNRAVRVSGEDVIFPAPVTVDIIDGIPQENFELLTLPAECHWKIIVWSDKNTPLRRDVTVPAGAGPFDFDELVDVDPSTALPDAGTALATAYLSSVQAAADIAQNATIRQTVYPLTYAATLTPNPVNGPIQTVTLTGNVTINAFSSPLSGQTIRLVLTQDATGSRLLTSTMKFAGGIKTLSTAANAIDILTISYIGTSYYATLDKGYV